jgi:hypothetical protein
MKCTTVVYLLKTLTLKPKHGFNMKRGFFLFSVVVILILFAGCKQSVIDRFDLVSRHNIRNSVIDSLSCLSVGNGDFAFTVDVTGLQTFPEFYSRGIPLGTMSDWGWHTSENPENFNLDDVSRTYQVHGRPVDYVHQFRPGEESRKIEASDWLRANPHRIHLGMIGLQIMNADGTETTISDVSDNLQVLDLWEGEIESTFKIEGVPVRVLTICHPDEDLISARIESDLIKQKRLRVSLHFPLGIAQPKGYDFSFPEKHTTTILSEYPGKTIFERRQDSDIYYVEILHKDGIIKESEKHLYYVEPDPANPVFEFSCRFGELKPQSEMPVFEATEALSRERWQQFWMNGGAVDFSKCKDQRAFELERRVILSQYLTRIQCSGSMPPAETGLTYNSWFGKFHLEMHWWHVTHFALWNREEILEKQMEYYFRIYDNARKTAEHQGYKGVRWPKMTDPDGRESPSTVGTYLIWQQPHPIFFAELLYSNKADKKNVLEKYKDIVFETADFMASYAWFDTTANRYLLGPVLIPAQESLRKETTINPVFEIAYWYWALSTAIDWKERLGMEPDPLWTDVIARLSGLPVADGLYLCSEDTKDSYSNSRYMSDHPMVAGINGMLPKTKLIDNEILANSLDTIMKKWNWRSTWGWDFPMLAMAAASVGRGEQAVDILLMDAPKNKYLLNGHNYQDARLSIYLPGNGGLLTAVAKMCVEDQFPKNGLWKVRWEGLNRYVE